MRRLSCFPVSFTLSVAVMITLGGSAAGLLISGQPLLRPWLPLAALLPAFSVCVCVCACTPLLWLNQCVYIRSLSPLCVRAICFLLLLCHRYDGPGSPLHVNLLHARCWLAACPSHLSSVSSSHFLSLPVYKKPPKNSLMSG